MPSNCSQASSFSGAGCLKIKTVCTRWTIRRAVYFWMGGECLQLWQRGHAFGELWRCVYSAFWIHPPSSADLCVGWKMQGENWTEQRDSYYSLTSTNKRTTQKARHNKNLHLRTATRSHTSRFFFFSLNFITTLIQMQRRPLTFKSKRAQNWPKATKVWSTRANRLPAPARRNRGLLKVDGPEFADVAVAWAVQPVE